MRKDKWGNTRQYQVKLGRETVRCNVMNLTIHPLQKWPILIEFQRYIPGRPNLINLSVAFVNLNQNVDYILGAVLQTYIDQVKLWCYNDTYPAKIEVDMHKVSCERPYKIGDLQRDMPEGMFLHRCYDRRKHEPLVKLLKSPAFQKKMMKTEEELEEESAKAPEQEHEEQKSDEEDKEEQDVEESLAGFQLEIKSGVNWEQTTTQSKEALRTQPIQELVEEDLQQDDLDPQDFYYFKDDLMRKLGVKGENAPKKDYPVFVKPTKVLIAQKKKLDQQIQESIQAQARPPSTGNRLNKKLHGKKHKKKMLMELQKKLEEQGHFKEKNLLEPRQKKERNVKAKEAEEEQKQKLLQAEKKRKQQVKLALDKIAEAQKVKDEMKKARQDAEKKGYNLRDYGFEILKKKMKEDVETEKQEENVEEKREKKEQKKKDQDNSNEK